MCGVCVCACVRACVRVRVCVYFVFLAWPKNQSKHTHTHTYTHTHTHSFSLTHTHLHTHQFTFVLGITHLVLSEYLGHAPGFSHSLASGASWSLGVHARRALVRVCLHTNAMFMLLGRTRCAPCALSQPGLQGVTPLEKHALGSPIRKPREVCGGAHTRASPILSVARNASPKLSSIYSLLNLLTHACRCASRGRPRA